MEIHTQRLTLKPFASEDAANALDILTDSEIRKTYMLPDYERQEDALPLFCHLMELSMDENHYVRGIYRNNRLIGLLNDVGIQDGAIELGYAIHPKHQGQGYMTEALRGAIRDIFDLDYREVVCGAFDENTASIRVMIKAGMQKLHKTEEIKYRDVLHHCIYYSIKKQEE